MQLPAAAQDSTSTTPESASTVQLQQQGSSDTPLSARNANYTMDVRLDVETRIIHGKMILNWRNITAWPAHDLKFHLYFNGWLNDKSSFLNAWRSASTNPKKYDKMEWAYTKIHEMKIQAEHGFSAATLTDKIEFMQPEDGNAHDRSLIRVPLDRPVAPGEQINIEIIFDTKVPKTFRRTGRRGDYYFMAHWFPKLGVLEDNGEWNARQYIQTEYYSNFGVYDVKINIPESWVIGATGRETETTEVGDGTTTHRFQQADVHAFTWTASPHFTVHTERFEHPDLPSVDMRLLLMPDHASKRDRYFAATAAALKVYGTSFGAYPYGHITIVDPGYKTATGGMEYPTIFTGGTRWLSPSGTHSPEGVTIHEAGHQYWYGIVANNEFDHAWMDEGFNTYSTTLTSEREYPPAVYSRRYFKGFIPVVFHDIKKPGRTAGADVYDGFRSALKRDKMSAASWQQSPGAYGLNSYSRPGMMLRTLENYFGWDVFHKIMTTYWDRWSFNHPRPHDFFAVVNDVSGRDMSWFFDQAWDDDVMFDYAVASVKSKKVNPPRGYVETDSSLTFQAGKAGKNDTTTVYQSSVGLRRWGGGIFPLQVQITFSDSTVLTENWDGKSRYKEFKYEKDAKVTKVVIDPEHILTLDTNYANNSWIRTSKAHIASVKWASKWMLWLQNFMEFFVFFA